MRTRAAPELFVGGFTQAWLDVPVLSLDGLDEDASERALLFFLTACLCRGATTARVEQPDRARLAASIAAAESGLGDAVQSIDADNAALMGYFDVYLVAADEIREETRLALEDRVARAFAR
jgi:hypothetical protein